MEWARENGFKWTWRSFATFYRPKSLLPQNWSNSEISLKRPRVMCIHLQFHVFNIIFIFSYTTHKQQQQQPLCVCALYNPNQNLSKTDATFLFKGIWLHFMDG